jgi:hypothetical protein
MSWTSNPLPSGHLASSLSCLAPGACVVLTFTPGSAYPPTGPSITLTTNDGGAQWEDAMLPSGTFVSGFSAISCAATKDCMALVSQELPNPDKCVGVPPNGGPPPGFFGCSTEATTVDSAVVTSSDGGLSWQLRPLPADVPLPQLFDVSCANGDTCWLSGSDAVPETIGNVHNGGSPLLIGTTDGGTTWSRATFDVPSGAPDYLGQAFLSVGSISCPAPTTCLALGVGAQSAPSVPLYRYIGG